VIFIEMTTSPHYKKVRWLPGENFKFDPTTPPHIVLKREFTTWDEAQHFVMDILDLRPTSTFESIFNNPENQYVQVEVELMDQTEFLYTQAVLAIEGNEDE
jgi:hypothetical protein